MKYSYNIAGLDCADCARRISEELNKNPKRECKKFCVNGIFP